MGRKSRLKKEKKQRELEQGLDRHPMKQEIRAFLKKRSVATDEASGLLYVISLIASFLVYLAIKKHGQLPGIRKEEDEADKKRFERLGMVVDYECDRLQIDPQEVMDELVAPMTKHTALMQPILDKVYGMLDSVVPSGNFRETAENQIENPEFWGDSLTHYADRKEDYLEAVEKLFLVVLVTVKSSLDDQPEKTDHQEELEEIRKTFEIEDDDFPKLRRRATDFFRIAFSTYLGMVFQPIRDEIDQKFPEPPTETVQ